MTADQVIIAQLQEMNARLLSMLAERGQDPAEEIPGLANEQAENLDLVHIYRTQGLEVWRVAHKATMAACKARMMRRAA